MQNWALGLTSILQFLESCMWLFFCGLLLFFFYVLHIWTIIQKGYLDNSIQKGFCLSCFVVFSCKSKCPDARQYFIPWLKLQANEVILVMGSGATFGVCHTVDVMMSWLGSLVLMDTVWLWFFIKSVEKQAAMPVPYSKRPSQMTVHHQKEIVFSHDCMLSASLRQSLCCP